MALILVVDDSPMIQKVTNAVLTKKGHDVRVAGVVKSAFTRIKGESFDLIIMDLNLPDLPGDETIEVIRKQMKIKVPIIVLSGSIEPKVIQRLKPLGISAFVAKSEQFLFRLSEEVDKVLSSASDEDQSSA